MSDKYIFAPDGRTAVPATDLMAWARTTELRINGCCVSLECYAINAPLAKAPRRGTDNGDTRYAER